MGILENFRIGLQNKVREYVLGKALVDSGLTSYGVDQSQYTPSEYGFYLATSNSVYTIATWRAELLAALPIRLIKHRGKEVLPVESGRLYDLLEKVNPHWTMNRMMRMTDMSLAIWGSAFWFLERGQNGRQAPREIWWGKPSNVTVFPDSERYIRGFEYSVAGKQLWFEPEEVIWFRYPNPNDEFSGLSPIAASRLSIEYAHDSLRSNRNLFLNGNQLGGIMFPKARTLTPDQAREIEAQVDRRSKGVDRAHRWNFFRFEVEAREFGVTPRDAEFLGGLRFSLEEVCRAYKWPQDLVGGQRSYENYNAAMKAAYTHAVLPNGEFIASELKEQLLPMFPGEADEIRFDASEVEVLQEQEHEEWQRSQGQIALGAITINEWRKSKGMDPVAWGDTWWASYAQVPVEKISEGDAVVPEPVEEPPEDEAEEERKKRDARAGQAIVYGSQAHEAIWRAFVRRTDALEDKVAKAVKELFKSQLESVLAGMRNAEESFTRDVKPPFNLKEWIKKFRMKLRPIFMSIVEEMGREEIKEVLKLDLAFDVKQPAVVRFVERMTQRFAVEVNETTWRLLKKSLAEGIDAGEGIDKLAKRVEAVMEDRIRSSAEVIARTETITASNGGKLLSYKQSGVVKGKSWLAALDARTRESHIEAHRRYMDNPIGLDEDFEVGLGAGPAPGQIGLPEEDIQCRCTILPEV